MMKKSLLFLGGEYNQKERLVSDDRQTVDMPVYPEGHDYDHIATDDKPIGYKTYRRRLLTGESITGKVECFGLDILEDDEVLDLYLRDNQS